MNLPEEIVKALDEFARLNRMQGFAKSFTERQNHVDAANKVRSALERAIEAALARGQEPVAWRYKYEGVDWDYTEAPIDLKQAQLMGWEYQPLYTSPPAAPAREVVYPEERPSENLYTHVRAASYNQGWNAAIAEMRRLNTTEKP